MEKYPCIEPNCPNLIIFTSREEEFFKSKGWVDGQGNPTKPKRCRKHRLEKKNAIENKNRQSGSDVQPFYKVSGQMDVPKVRNKIPDWR